MSSNMERLDALAGLQQDWDSYGAPPPSAAAIKTARELVRFAEHLAELWPITGAPKIHIFPTHSGGILFETPYPPEGSRDLEVLADGTIADDGEET